MRVLLATTNTGKIAELRRLLAGIGVELVGLADVARYPEPAETGATFADNALLKARAAVTATGLTAVADDSGLCVEALNGMPGVLSARWSGMRGPRAEVDRANLELVLAQLADVPEQRRGARFVCAAAVATPAGRDAVVLGELRGRLLAAPRGSGGFGYDPIFVPDGGDPRTTAELSPQDKDAISHRGRAFRRLVPLIAELTGTGPGAGGRHHVHGGPAAGDHPSCSARPPGP